MPWNTVTTVDTDDTENWSVETVTYRPDGSRYSRQVEQDTGALYTSFFDINGNNTALTQIDSPANDNDWDIIYTTYRPDIVRIELDNGNTVLKSSAADNYSWTIFDYSDLHDFTTYERQFHDYVTTNFRYDAEASTLSATKLTFDDGSKSAKFYDEDGRLIRTNTVTSDGVSTKQLFTYGSVITEVTDTQDVLDIESSYFTDFRDDRWDIKTTFFDDPLKSRIEKFDASGTLRELVDDEDLNQVKTTFDEDGIIQTQYTDAFFEGYYLNQVFEDGIVRISERTDLSFEFSLREPDEVLNTVDYFDEDGDLELRAIIDAEDALGKIITYEDGQITDRVLVDINDEKAWNVIDISYNEDGTVASRDVYLDGQALADDVNADVLGYFDYG